MKQKAGIFVLIVSLIANFYFLLNHKINLSKTEKSIVQRVARVIDGDTFDTETGIRIRLAGISAPEYPNGCLSLKAKERLEELVLGKEVKIEIIDKDNFGREVGFVFERDVFTDKVLLEEGLGMAKNGKNPTRGATLLQAEDSAKKAKRGVWSSLCTGKDGCYIKGNVRRDKGTKTYHFPECYNYEKIVINEAEKDQWFCTEQEAKAASFAKAEDCPE